MISVEILKILALLTACSFALWFILAPRGQQDAVGFSGATNLIALGSPAVPDRTDTPEEIARREKAIAEFRAMERMYLAQRHHIERAQTRFEVLRTLKIAPLSHGEASSTASLISIPRPSDILRSAVIVGDSVAGAGLTPGTTVYWLEVPGAQFAELIARDATVLPDLDAGQVRQFICGHVCLTLFKDGGVIEDLRKHGAGVVSLIRGAPILLRLDEYSQSAMREALEEKAPQAGLSSKVRLFGGFQIDVADASLQILPLRQEPGMPYPEEGRLHDLAGLLGVVVGKSSSKAFKWEPTAAARYDVSRAYATYAPPPRAQPYIAQAG